MRPNFLQALHIFWLYRAVCPSPVNINDTPLLQPVGLDTLGNTSTSRPVEWNVRFPYRIRVPNTPTVVRLGFDEPRRPLDPDEWRSFLNLVQGSIRLDIEEHGGATVYPLNIFHEQIIEKTWLGMDLEIVGSFLVPPFTYQVLWEVLQALRIFMVDGRRNYQARFNFWSGPGLFPDWGTPRGEGQVRRVKIFLRTSLLALASSSALQQAIAQTVGRGFKVNTALAIEESWKTGFQ
ncbi:mannosyl-oligosaccharide glucosidase [Physcia stellaris]|nr:mannosyl-oligosaccharide glucosidase [Physcia stellaris]